MLDPILKNLLLLHQLSHISICGVFSRVLFQNLKPISQVLAFILILEYVCVEVVNHLTLSLNGFSERKVTLENLLHHIDCMNDALCDCVFGLVDRTR